MQHHDRLIPIVVGAATSILALTFGLKCAAESKLPDYAKERLTLVTSDFSGVRPNMPVGEAMATLQAHGFRADRPVTQALVSCGPRKFMDVTVRACQVQEVNFTKSESGTLYKVLLKSTLTRPVAAQAVLQESVVWAIAASIQPSDPRVGNNDYLVRLAYDKYPNLKGVQAGFAQCIIRSPFRPQTDFHWDIGGITMSDDDDTSWCKEIDSPMGTYITIEDAPSAVIMHVVIANHSVLDIKDTLTLAKLVATGVKDKPIPQPVKPTF